VLLGVAGRASSIVYSSHHIRPLIKHLLTRHQEDATLSFTFLELPPEVRVMVVPLVMTMPAEPTDEDCRREPYTYRVSARKTCGLLLYPQQSAHKGFEATTAVHHVDASQKRGKKYYRPHDQSSLEWVWSPVCHSSYPLYPPFHYATL